MRRNKSSRINKGELTGLKIIIITLHYTSILSRRVICIPFLSWAELGNKVKKTFCKPSTIRPSQRNTEANERGERWKNALSSVFCSCSAYLSTSNNWARFIIFAPPPLKANNWILFWEIGSRLFVVVVSISSSSSQAKKNDYVSLLLQNEHTRQWFWFLQEQAPPVTEDEAEDEEASPVPTT